MRRFIEQGSTYETDIGYSRAVIVGDTVYVSGTTGIDYSTMEIAEGIDAQCRRALDNIRAALDEAGASPDEVVRVTYLLPDRDDFAACWPMIGEFFARARPAATMIQAGLIDPRMRIEIEVTAVRGSAAQVPGSNP